MARTIYEARLKSNNTLTPLVRELVIEFINPPHMEFQAGQFVMLHVPNPETGKPDLRAYSLASDDRIQNEFKLIIKLVGEGKASQFIRDLKAGTKMQFTGPFGKLLFKQPAAPNVVLVCTGAGLSQHMSFLLSHAHKFSASRFSLMVGVWNEGEMFYVNELDALQKQLKNFNYQFVLDSPAATWKGKKGFVTQYLGEQKIKNDDTHVYMCGNPAMIKSVKAELEKIAFPADRTFAESFG
ncbi:MAG: FAD-dependent oxidoreductase [Bdellovibrionia bacterium]